MEKVWIINNSLFGNSHRVSNEIAERLKGKYETKVIKIRKLNLQEITKDKVDILIIGARVIAFRADRKLRKFLKKKLGNFLDGKLQKTAVFYTHDATWKPRFRKKMDKTLKKLSYIPSVFPEILTVKVLDDKESLFEDGYEQKLEKFIQAIIS